MHVVAGDVNAKATGQAAHGRKYFWIDGGCR